MDALKASLVSSTCLPLRRRLCSVGGCIGSPEDKIAILCSQNLLVVSPALNYDQPESSNLSSISRVFVKHRAAVWIRLDDDTVANGTDDPNESRVAFAECANRSVVFPFENIYRDTILERTGIRNVDWSPRGVETFGRCVLSVVTQDGRAAVLSPKDPDAWDELIDLSSAWQSYYVVHGRAAIGYVSEVDARPRFDPNAVPIASETPLVCKTLPDYLDAVEDITFSSCSWSQLPRRPQPPPPVKEDIFRSGPTVTSSVNNSPLETKKLKSMSSPVLSLATLMKSGAIAIWATTLPITGLSSLFLTYVDYTYAVTRRVLDKNAKKRAIFLKFCDLDSTHAMLILALSDGSVVAVVYDLHFSSDGSFWIQLSHKLSICSYAIMYTPVIACAWSMSDGLLCLGYGSHLLVSEIKVLVRADTVRRVSGVIYPTYQVVFDHMTKPDESCGFITGVHLHSRMAFITTLDGYLARLKIENTQQPSCHWKILWSRASCADPDQVHWEFHGLSVSCNGVYMYFVENPVNYLDNVRRGNLAVYSAQVRFLSFWSDDKVLDLVFNPKVPLNRKSDALHQLIHRWKSQTNDSDQKNLRNKCIQHLQLHITDHSENTLPPDWTEQPLTLLHLYRQILHFCLSDPDESVKSRAKNWLPLLDALIRDSHLDRCFRLFLQNSVQRQAADCILVIRMSSLVLDYYRGRDPSCSSATPENAPHQPLSKLYASAEKAMMLARQLYVYRFKLPSSDLPSGPAKCPVCSESIIPDLSQSNCPNSHRLDRCMQTLEPLTDTFFRQCERCLRIAVWISPTSHVSSWHMSAVHPMCVYCDSSLTWKEL